MTLNIESLLYQISAIFLVPALLIIVVALFYTIYATGSTIAEAWARRKEVPDTGLTQYALSSYVHSDDLELWIMRRLELLRLTSRITPLLGLVATLIPMGPALLALSNNDTATIGENMVLAFSGVTLALIAASLSFAVLNVRRRWLFEELRQIERNQQTASVGV